MAGLFSVFQIRVEEESGDIYPSGVCHGCYLTLRKLLNAKEAGQYRNTDLVPLTWIPHNDLCQLCENTSVTPRGRPKKRRGSGRPRADDIQHQGRKIYHHVGHLQTHKYYNTSLDSKHFLATLCLEDLHCVICHSIPNEPVQIQGCGHLMCVTCVCSRCESESETACCSGVPIAAESLCVPSALIKKCLDNLLIHCVKGCGQILEFKHLMIHTDSECTNTPLPST